MSSTNFCIALLYAIARSAIAILAVHIMLHCSKHGLAIAWQKSIARKGSWTASLYHFFAMWSKHQIVAERELKGPNLSDAEEKDLIRRERNIYGRYCARSGERHNSDGKKRLRELHDVKQE